MAEKVELIFDISGNADKKLKKTGDEGKKAVDKISKSTKQASKSMSVFNTNAKKAGVAIGAFVGIAGAKKVFDFVKSVNANRDAMLNLSNATGIAVKDLSELQYAAELNKTSFTAVEASLKKMVMTVGMAEQGSKTAKEAFSGLGVELKKSDGTLKSVNDLFEESVEALSNVENKTERLTKAQLVFGRGATELGSIIDGGADALRRAKDEAEGLGVAFDRLDAEQSAKFNDEMLRLESRSKGLAMTLSTMLTPAITDFIEGWNELLSSKDENRGLVEQFAFDKESIQDLQTIIKLTREMNEQPYTEEGAIRAEQIKAQVAPLKEIYGVESLHIDQLREINQELVQIVKQRKGMSKIKPNTNGVSGAGVAGESSSMVDFSGSTVGTQYRAKSDPESEAKLKVFAALKASRDKKAKELQAQADLEAEIAAKAALDQELQTQSYIKNADIRIAKAKEEGEARIAQNDLMNDSYLTMTNTLIDSAQKGLSASKASANAQKAVAIGQIQMNAAVGMMKVWADPGYPAAIPLTIAIGAQSTASSAMVSQQSFEKSGVVGGNSYTGDRNSVNANTGEMFIDRYKQKNLFDMISNGSGGGGSNITVNFNNNVGLDTGKIVSVVQSAVQRGSKTNRPIGMGV